jgi:hypothetical protein
MPRLDRLHKNGISTRRFIPVNSIVGTPDQQFQAGLQRLDLAGDTSRGLMAVGAQRVIQNDGINSALREMGQPLLHTAGRQCFVPTLI